MSTNLVKEKQRQKPLNLVGAHIPGTDLSDTNLAGAHFSNANVSNVEFSTSILTHAHFLQSNLASANLENADLSNADLSSADLSEATLDGANCNRTNFNFAELKNASLDGTDLSEAQNLSWRDLLDARIFNSTVLPRSLDVDGFFETLTLINPNIDWRSESQGNIEEVIRVFENLYPKLERRSLMKTLREIRIYQENKLDE